MYEALAPWRVTTYDAAPERDERAAVERERVSWRRETRLSDAAM